MSRWFPSRHKVETDHSPRCRSQAFKDDTWRKEPLLRSALEARSPEEQKTGLLKYTKAQMAGIISSCWPVESGRVSRTILYRFAGKTASDYAPGLARLMLRSSNVISLEDIFGKALAAEIRDAQEKAHKEYEQHVQEQGPLNIEYVSSNRRMTIQALFWELATSALTDREKMDPESKEFEDARV